MKSKAKGNTKDFVDQMAKCAQEAAQHGDMRTLYDIAKNLAGDYGKGGERPVKDKNGKTLSSPEEQKTRWAEHFNEILNRPPPNETFEFNQIEKIDELPILMTLIDQIEAKTALERLKIAKLQVKIRSQLNF